MSQPDALVPTRMGISDMPKRSQSLQTQSCFEFTQDSPVPAGSALKEATNNKPASVSSNPNTGGGFVDYYLQEVKYPQRGGAAYTAECDDLIEALNLNFDEGEIFKEIWRSARQRQGMGKPGNTLLRGREKIFHRARRLLKAAEHLV